MQADNSLQGHCSSLKKVSGSKISGYSWLKHGLSFKNMGITSYCILIFFIFFIIISLCLQRCLDWSEPLSVLPSEGWRILSSHDRNCVCVCVKWSGKHIGCLCHWCTFCFQVCIRVSVCRCVLCVCVATCPVMGWYPQSLFSADESYWGRGSPFASKFSEGSDRKRFQARWE